MNPLCPFCSSTSQLAFRTKDFNQQLSDAEFSYYRCQKCRLMFQSPVPANLADYYPQSYYAAPTLEELAARVEPQRYKLDTVQRFVSSGRLLDIGAAWGDFAYPAKQAGYEVEAVEMDEQCCEFLRDIVGVEATHSADVSATLVASDRRYDAITMWQVIEHLPDPLTVLKLASERLNNGGVLVVATPNPASLQFRFMGRLWPHVDAPRHLTLIPIDLLIAHANTLGLKPVLVTSSDNGALLNNDHGWLYGLRNRFTHPRLRGLAHRTGWVAHKLLAPIERTDFLGSTYTIAFSAK